MSWVTTSACSRRAVRITDASMTSDVPVRPQRTPAASARISSSTATSVVGPASRARKAHLPRGIAPNLTDDARGHEETRARSQHFAAQRAHSRVPPLERDESACV